MSSAAIAYATDEHVALRAPTDYRLLYPRDQNAASGDDGYFQMGDPWTLRSSLTDFETRGVEPGQIVQIMKPGSSIRPDGEGFVVLSASGGTLSLRRPGQYPGAGQPPVTIDGLTGVSYVILTFHPQIALVSDEFDRRFGISRGARVGSGASSLTDPGELQDAVVLTVLARQYSAMCRELGSGASSPSDPFAAKGQALRAELDDVLARLTLHWNVTGPNAAISPPTTRFSTRMSR